MPHVVTGEIRRDVFRKEGSNSNGPYVMYAVELSESFKDKKTGERTYTNYKALLFAGTPPSIAYYDDILVKGKTLSLSSECLKIEVRDGNDRQFITAEMVDPKIVFAQRSAGTAGGNGNQSQPQQSHQPAPRTQQNSAAHSQPNRTNNRPDFDDDIPF